MQVNDVFPPGIKPETKTRREFLEAFSIYAITEQKQQQQSEVLTHALPARR